ncbi:hypothetical protein PR048_017623 [Dryococelus australis]|uniref:Mutator-like transposase domain-containing protein n=1 Tax=Dryococelus australis TaxID=614101 RepID=A0ABQ9HA47_9NEOP|nr:hypothetical protein PR048_017623 [Dryococelus australis]
MVSDPNGENVTSASFSNNAGIPDNAFKTKLSNGDNAYSSDEDENCDIDFIPSNARFAYGMRAIDKGHTAAELLCGILDLPQPPCRMNKYAEVIGTSLETVATASMEIAAEEAIQLNDGDKNIPVAFGGTWQKRGHTSKKSAATVTNKCRFWEGVRLRSADKKNCFKCNFPTEEHNYDKNYEGTSGCMEAAAAVNIWNRSEKDRNVCYTEFLGDRDSKAHKRVVEENPYKKKKIKKIERVGHVQKRMGIRLTKLKQSLSGKDFLIVKPFMAGSWGVNDAVTAFNEGNFGRFKVLQELDISPGPSAVKTFKFLDKVRIQK